MKRQRKLVVLQLSDSWPREGAVSISTTFQDQIEGQAKHGRSLHSWQYQQALLDGRVIETIVAIYQENP